MVLGVGPDDAFRRNTITAFANFVLFVVARQKFFAIHQTGKFKLEVVSFDIF